MQAIAQKFRVCTVQTVKRDDIVAAFGDVIVDAQQPNAVLQCRDGSQILLHPSSIEASFFAEFQIHLEPSSLGILSRVIEFCKQHGGKIKSIRNGFVYPASASFIDEVWRSQAYRTVRHSSENPSDVAALKRASREDDV